MENQVEQAFVDKLVYLSERYESVKRGHPPLNEASSKDARFVMQMAQKTLDENRILLQAADLLGLDRDRIMTEVGNRMGKANVGVHHA